MYELSSSQGSLGRRRAFAALVLGSAIAAACSAGGDSVAESGSSGDSGSGANSGSGSNTGGSASTLSSASGGNSNGAGGLEECAGEEFVGDLQPVDVVIMFDQSGSMSSTVGNDTIWSLVTKALTDFVQAPESDGLGVGLQYFPLPDGPCTSCNGCFQPDLQLTDPPTMQCCCSKQTGVNCGLPNGTACPSGGVCFQGQCYSGGANATCNVGNYASLEVPVDVLPNNAAPIIASLGMHSPAGLTPTSPALQGAIQAAQARAQQFPDHVVAVVLATDGVPTECDPQDVNQIAAFAAAAAAASPPVLTYVIGIGDVTALNAIAQAGGTNKAFLISANGNAGQQFIDALNDIQGDLLACEFDIPEPRTGVLDFSLVNVQFTPEGQPAQIVPQVPSAAACDASGGWYYDDPQNPTKILLCPASCDQAKAAMKATLQIVLGCQTIVK